MTGAGGLAFAAGALGVWAAWDAVAEVEASRIAGWLRRAAEPLRRAEREGIESSGSERRRLALVTAAALGAAGWLLHGWLLACLTTLSGPAAAGLLLRSRQRRHRARLHAEAAPAARAIADALSAGGSVRGALATASASLPGAAGAALTETARALALGDTTEEALERLRRRSRSSAWNTMVAAMLLTRDAGGDLAALLRDLASSLEAAERLERDARTATAQARFTAWLVGALPLGGAALAELAQPGTLTGLLGHPVSLWLVAAAAVLQVAALLVIRRLAR